MDNQTTKNWQDNNTEKEEFGTPAMGQGRSQFTAPIPVRPLSPATPTRPTPQATAQASAPSQADASDIDGILQNMSNEEILRAFAEGLLIEKGLGEMEPEVKEEMVEDLLERINAFVDRAALESLPPEKLEELNRMIDNDTATPDNVAELIKNSGQNTDEMVAKALEKFRDVYLGQEAKE